MFRSVLRRSKALVRPVHDDVKDHHHEYDDYDDMFVWDVLNPFAPPDPTEDRVRSFIQAEITRMRRYERVGPLQSLRDAEKQHKHNPIVLPPLPIITTSTTTTVTTITPSPTTSSADGDHPSFSLSDSDIAEAEQQERARKAKRDAHRSRLKLLSILGPEAGSAI